MVRPVVLAHLVAEHLHVLKVADRHVDDLGNSSDQLFHHWMVGAIILRRAPTVAARALLTLDLGLDTSRRIHLTLVGAPLETAGSLPAYDRSFLLGDKIVERCDPWPFRFTRDDVHAKWGKRSGNDANIASMSPGPKAGFIVMFRRSGEQRTLGSMKWQTSHVAAQFTDIQPGAELHAPHDLNFLHSETACTSPQLGLYLYSGNVPSTCTMWSCVFPVGTREKTKRWPMNKFCCVTWPPGGSSATLDASRSRFVALSPSNANK
eukprot:CAMPEP_0117518572 /NCGR_PEP_ID=MMETSP0784-20121206/32200_1 /TAXON_ID=39447 /ORGANISM="" /LENGTH=262 /DNA_ID=CAMNT_0005314495 /DNA_START=412 /DNA_END=1201 /DNA_ORIENTATION=+